MKAFLTGEWRLLAMLNYQVDPLLLAPYVPRGTTLDSWRGAAYVSVVGFLFRDTRLLGVPIPLHRNFEEVNLRFYVRREHDGETRRGVTFIREIVPRRAIATIARLAYNEPYVALPMTNVVERRADGDVARVEYAWRQGDDWSRLAVQTTGRSRDIAVGSEAEFITEHYWGYTRQRGGGTVEYQVQHPRWRVWDVAHASLSGDLRGLYGPTFGDVVAGEPHSAFLADGSPIAVGMPTHL